jgi:hypothetical protein
MPEYISRADNEHERLEELQWAEILAGGDPRKGMLIVFVQKLCTAFHEFDPAFRAGGLNPEKLDFFKERLTGRINKVIDLAEDNPIEGLKGIEQLAQIMDKVQASDSLEDLAVLAEEIHQVNHIICDSLVD